MAPAYHSWCGECSSIYNFPWISIDKRIYSECLAWSKPKTPAKLLKSGFFVRYPASLNITEPQAVEMMPYCHRMFSVFFCCFYWHVTTTFTHISISTKEETRFKAFTSYRKAAIIKKFYNLSFTSDATSQSFFGKPFLFSLWFIDLNIRRPLQSSCFVTMRNDVTILTDTILANSAEFFHCKAWSTQRRRADPFFVLFWLSCKTRATRIKPRSDSM